MHEYAVNSEGQYQLILYLELVLLADLKANSQEKWVSSIKYFSFLQDCAFNEEIHLLSFVKQALNKPDDFLQIAKENIII